MHSVYWLLHDEDNSAEEVLCNLDGEINYESMDREFELTSDQIGRRNRFAIATYFDDGDIDMLEFISKDSDMCNEKGRYVNTGIGAFDERDITYNDYLYDWYSVGNRWVDTLVVKKGAADSPHNIDATAPFYKSEEPENELKCSSAYIKDIDWDKMEYIPYGLIYADGEPTIQELDSRDKEWVKTEVENSGYPIMTVIDCHS